MVAHLLQLLLTSIVVSQVVFQQCCDARDVPVVVTRASRGVASNVRDIAVDRDNNLLYVSNTGYCVYRFASNGASAQVIAGSGASGATDGVGGAARFGNLYGITCDIANNIAYICDWGNNRIRMLNLTNNIVATLAGSSPGTDDGIGVAAEFTTPFGIVHYTSRIDGIVLFVAEESSKRIRRIVVASARVTTVAYTTYNCRYLCISRDGSSLFVGTTYTVVRINTSTNAIVTLAGGASTGSTDGIGASARFNGVTGIALNSDETALFVVDYGNSLVRRLELQLLAALVLQRELTILGEASGIATRRRSSVDSWWRTIGTTRFSLLQSSEISHALQNHQMK